MIALKMYSNVIVFVVFICSYEGIKINVGVQAPQSQITQPEVCRVYTVPKSMHFLIRFED